MACKRKDSQQIAACLRDIPRTSSEMCTRCAECGYSQQFLRGQLVICRATLSGSMMTLHKSVRKPWTAEEDATLLQLTSKYGTAGCWPQIALVMDSRTGKQCRERYINHLDPDIKKTSWCAAEDEIIRRLFPEHGTKWSQYMPSLPGRSDNAIKNRYHVISRYGIEARTRSDSMSATSAGAPKRTCHTISADENDSHVTFDQDSDACAKRLKRLHNAREIVERKIREIEDATSVEETVTSITLNEEDFKSELGPDFYDLSFLWNEDEAEVAEERRLLVPTESFTSSIDSAELPGAAFDFSCYDIGF